MENTPKVVVLMSTYNGEHYLEEQLDSIFNQSYPNIELWVRDDGSKDTTMNVLNHYASIRHNIKVLSGDNVGVCKSFLDLLEKAPNADYYAFSDQDDIWEIDKIKAAVYQLEARKNKSKALLYCSALRVVDKELRDVGIMHENAIITKGSSLVDYKGTGCTMVFNAQARELVLTHLPSRLMLHDMWLFHTCVFLGELIFDNSPYILYRQHGDNEVGWEMTFKARMKSRLRSLHHLGNQHYREEEAKNLLSSYCGSLSEQDVTMIKIVAEYKKNWYNRLRFIFSSEVKFKKNFGRNFWLIMRILCGVV